MINRVLKNGFYVHIKFFDDGYYDNVDCYLGPFETSKNAHSMINIIDNDRWVTGRLVRCCTYVEEVKENETCIDEKM